MHMIGKSKYICENFGIWSVGLLEVIGQCESSEDLRVDRV